MSTVQKIRLVSEIFFWNLFINIMLRFSNLNSLLNLSTPRTTKDYSQKDIPRIIGYVDFVLNRSQFIFKKTCLMRSLVLYHFMRRHNCNVDMHIGVRNEEAQIAGHSWLTLNGEVFADSEEKINDFALIFNYPP